MDQNASSDIAQKMNSLGERKVPFLFIIDFELKQPKLIPLSKLANHSVLFDINGFRNYSAPEIELDEVSISKKTISFNKYRVAFDNVYNHLNYGNSYLVNLTCRTEIELSHSLKEIFHICRAKYKLLYDDEFLVFSPEIFVKIHDGKIASYPMKGTIDAGISNAREKILENEKELAEHVTIVDLIRNDLSRIAKDVHVNRFRYIDEIQTHEKNLLQVSSEIIGTLPEGYSSKIGDIIFSMLPAGSVSGAPKQKTLQIIRESEQQERGYFTGVFGYFDGINLDSGVMIRFIEKEGKNFFFRSGGGITVNSDAESEYNEMIDKIYVPIT